MADGFEFKLGKRRERLRAAIARSAVENVRLILVQRGNGFLKISSAEIYIRRPSYVARGKFLRRADVEHHNLLVGDQLLRLLGVNVYDIGFSRRGPGDAARGDDELYEMFQQRV